MSRLKNIFVAAVLLSSVHICLCAQPFELSQRRNFWNDGRNVSGIRADSVSISYAELYASYVGGGFRDSWQADDSRSAGAVAATVSHLKKFSLKGSFSFDHTTGNAMCGSMFINPGFYPVDVLEFTPGRKNLQTYSFEGGISADLAPRWRIGAAIDFGAANYSKRKDLRHANYRLDMTVTPGFMWHRGDCALGLVYIFNKNSETVSAEQIGTAASSYYAFLDKGLMFGNYEVWTGSGMHLAEFGIDGFPVKETSHGVALQGQYGHFYADAEYLFSYGTIGEKQTEWFNFPGKSVTVRAAWSFRGADTEHFLRIKYSWQRRSNYENVLEKVTEGGVTLTSGYGSNRIFEEQKNTVSPSYELMSPLWDFRAVADFSHVEGLSTQVWPYVFYRRTFTVRVSADAVVHLGAFDLGAALGFACGDIDETQRIAAEAGAVSGPFRLEEWRQMQNEYMTARRISAGLSFRYNFYKGLYAEISADYMHGFALKYLPGPDRWTASLRLGYNF